MRMYRYNDPRTFAYDLAQSIVSNHSNLLGGELLPKLVVRVHKLSLVVLCL